MIFRWSMVVNAIKSALKLAWARKRGYVVLADEFDYTIRKSICNSCEFHRDGQCMQCGCFTDAKALLNPESCPKKKWQAIWVKRTI